MLDRYFKYINLGLTVHVGSTPKGENGHRIGQRGILKCNAICICKEAWLLYSQSGIWAASMEESVALGEAALFSLGQWFSKCSSPEHRHEHHLGA